MNTIIIKPVGEEKVLNTVEQKEQNKLVLPDGRELGIGEIVKDRKATFSFYRQGYIYYNLQIADLIYSFPIPVQDLDTATVSAEEKAMTLMRYIRKALAAGQLVRSRG